MRRLGPKQKTAEPQVVELERHVNDALDKHAKELGHFLHAWNDLHLAITSLYLATCKLYFDVQEEEFFVDEQSQDVLLAIWNAIPNNRMQRAMLRQAAHAKYDRLRERLEPLGVYSNVIGEQESQLLK